MDTMYNHVSYVMYTTCEAYKKAIYRHVITTCN